MEGLGARLLRRDRPWLVTQVGYGCIETEQFSSRAASVYKRPSAEAETCDGPPGASYAPAGDVSAD